MMQFATVHSLAAELGMDESPETTTVGDLTDRVIELGGEPHVFAFHDSHLWLKNNLPEELRSTSLSTVDDLTTAGSHREEIERLLYEGETVLRHYDKELTEDDEQAILEDEQSRGFARD